jgi:CHASE3 domain sensor protein
MTNAAEYLTTYDIAESFLHELIELGELTPPADDEARENLIDILAEAVARGVSEGELRASEGRS